MRGTRLKSLTFLRMCGRPTFAMICLSLMLEPAFAQFGNCRVRHDLTPDVLCETTQCFATNAKKRVQSVKAKIIEAYKEGAAVDRMMNGIIDVRTNGPGAPLRLKAADPTPQGTAEFLAFAIQTFKDPIAHGCPYDSKLFPYKIAELTLGNSDYCEGRATVELKSEFRDASGRFLPRGNIRNDPLGDFPLCARLATTTAISTLFDPASKTIQIVQSDLLDALQSRVTRLEQEVLRLGPTASKQ